MKNILFYIVAVVCLSFFGFTTSAYAQLQLDVSPCTQNINGQLTVVPCPSASNPPTNQQTGDLTYVPLEPLRGLEEAQSGTGNFGDLIKGFFRLLVNIGAFIAVTMLVIGGITYMVSEKTFTKLVAREKIKAAFFGMAILAGAWLILNTINPQLLMFKKDLVGPSNSSTQNTTQSGGGQSTLQNLGKFIDDCESGGGTYHNTASGPECRQ